MRRFLKWLKYLVLTVLVLALCAVGAAYAISEYKLRRTHETPPIDLDLPTDPAAIEEGRRLATLRGCYRGCHAELEGQVMMDRPFMLRLVAPNLTTAVDRYGPEGVARIVRHGVRPDGTTTTGMPSEMFYYLSDEDLARIIAFIRSAEPVESNLPDTRYRIMSRVIIALGAFEPDAERVAALGPRPPVPERGPTPEYGRYLAMTVCTECHGERLEGGFDGKAPPLSIAKGYSREAFARLMREGVPIGDRELDVMGDVARSRFSVFTDEELDALYAFLQTAEIPLQGADYEDAGVGNQGSSD